MLDCWRSAAGQMGRSVIAEPGGNPERGSANVSDLWGYQLGYQTSIWCGQAVACPFTDTG